MYNSRGWILYIYHLRRCAAGMAMAMFPIRTAMAPLHASLRQSFILFMQQAIFLKQ